MLLKEFCFPKKTCFLFYISRDLTAGHETQWAKVLGASIHYISPCLAKGGLILDSRLHQDPQLPDTPLRFSHFGNSPHFPS